MLQAVSSLSENELNPALLLKQDFDWIKQELTRKLAAADCSLQRAKDFITALTGVGQNAPLLIQAAQETGARIGVGRVAGYIGASSSASTSGSTVQLSIDTLVSELGLFPNAIPLIEKLGADIKDVDLNDLNAIQRIVPVQIFECLNKARALEQERVAMAGDDPLKGLKPIEEYLKMLAIAIKQTPAFTEFLKTAKIDLPVIQFVMSQILLAYYKKENNGEVEAQFRAAIDNLGQHSEFKNLNQFMTGLNGFLERGLDAAKTKDHQTRIAVIRQRRIGNPGNASQDPSGRAGALSEIRKALKGKNKLEDLDLRSSLSLDSPSESTADARGFLTRLAKLSPEDILMLNSDLDEARILMLYLVNGMRALSDLRLVNDLEGNPRRIPLVDPSIANIEQQFRTLELSELQTVFNKARLRIGVDFHPDRVAGMFQKLTGKDDEAKSKELGAICLDWLNKIEKIPEFGVGWTENYFGDRLNDIYQFVKESDLIDHISSEAIVEPSRARKLMSTLSRLESRQGILSSAFGAVARILSGFQNTTPQDKDELNSHLKSLTA